MIDCRFGPSPQGSQDANPVLTCFRMEPSTFSVEASTKIFYALPLSHTQSRLPFPCPFPTLSDPRSSASSTFQLDTLKFTSCNSQDALPKVSKASGHLGRGEKKDNIVTDLPFHSNLCLDSPFLVIPTPSLLYRNLTLLTRDGSYHSGHSSC